MGKHGQRRLCAQAQTQSTAVGIARTAKGVAQQDLDTSTTAVSNCESTYADDLQRLEAEVATVQTIKTQLDAWAGSAAAANADAAPGAPGSQMPPSLAEAVAAVSVKPCKDFAGCAAGQFQDGECTSVTSTVKCTGCKQACAVGKYMQGTCDGKGKTDTITCTACGSCPDGQVLQQECSGETTSDTHTCEPHQEAKECKVINNKAAMLAAGWRITGDNPNNQYYDCSSNFCQGGVDRQKAYCGFQYPGVGSYEYTLTGSGTAHVAFGNSWHGTTCTVNIYKNNVKLGTAPKLTLNQQLAIPYVDGDVLKIDELNDGVMVLEEFCLQ